MRRIMFLLFFFALMMNGLAWGGTPADGKTTLLDLLRDDATGMEFVLVKGGCFTMGDDASKDFQLKPAHKVCLDSFWLATKEVTQEQYEKVIGANPSKLKGANLPVDSVSWLAAEKFLKKLSTLSGRKYRLPTEAEWEYAARGGVASKGFVYAGSNTLDDVAWTKANSGATSHPVGQKAGNELGLFDMSGNVWEWCADWHDFAYYESSPQDNPKGPSKGEYRVVRGGSWFYGEGPARATYRLTGVPDSAVNNFGFRVALTP